MGRGVAYNRAQNERIIKKRRKIWSRISPKWLEERGTQGKFKKNNFSCGCSGCKPHKHGLDKKFKPSELKRLQDE